MKFVRKILKFFLWSTGLITVFSIALGYVVFSYLPGKLYDEAQGYKPFDVIIVPGVPYNGNKISDIMKARIEWAHYLYTKGIAKNIIFSGSAVYSPFIESKVMALYARELGVDSKNIFTETNAEHSTENLYYSYRLAKQEGFSKIALATDPFQNMMLWNFRKNVAQDIVMIPINFDILKKLNYQNISINAQSAKVQDFVSIVERETWSERFKGTLGKKIKRVE